MALSTPVTGAISKEAVPVAASFPAKNEEMDSVRDQLLQMHEGADPAPDSLVSKDIQNIVLEEASNALDSSLEERLNLFIDYMESGDEDSALKLLESGIGKVGIRDEHGMTLLHFACKAGMEKVAFALMERGADPYALEENNLFPFTVAEQNGHKRLAGKIVLTLDPIKVREFFGYPRIMILSHIINDEVGLWELIDSHKEEIDDQDDKGRTVLHLLFQQNQIESAMEFIQAGANVDLVDNEGFTPLGRLAGLLPMTRELPEEIIQLFKDRNVDIEEISRDKTLAHIWGIEEAPEESTRENFKYNLLGAKTNDAMMEKSTSYIEEFLSTMGGSIACLSGVNTSQLLAPLKAMPANLNRSAEQIAADIRAKKTVAIPTGWSGHQAAVIFAVINGKHVLLKCQRGDGAIFPGVEICEIGTLDKLEEVIINLKQITQEPKKGIAFYNEGLKEKLGLTRIAVLAQNPQDKSNCPWATMKTLFLGLLYVNFREKLTHDAAAKNAMYVYKTYTPYSRIKALYDYTKDTKEPNVPLLEKIKAKIDSTTKLAIINVKEQLKSFIEPLFPKPPIEIL